MAGTLVTPIGATAQSADRQVEQATAVIRAVFAPSSRRLRAVFAAAERADMAALDTLYAGDSLTGRGTYILERAGVGSKSRWIVRHSHTASRARRPNDPPMPG